MSATGLPFDDIRALVTRMPMPDGRALHDKRHREMDLAKPIGGLGRIEDLSDWLAAWQGRVPAVNRPVVAIFAANHGVAARGVTIEPASTTQVMVEAFAAGGAAVNQICAAHDLGLKVFDLALDHPTGDISVEDALDEKSCAATMAYGMECLAGEPDLLCLAEMGIGGSTAASAVLAAVFGGDPAEWVGHGRGLDEAGLTRKKAAVVAALDRNAGHLSDPLEILRRLGGREIAAIAGAILAARHQRVPVILDGFAGAAAAAILYRMDRATLDHCLFAQVAPENAHRRALEAMGKVPLLALGIGMGEGVGAALAAVLVKTSALVHTGMATREQTGLPALGATR